MKKLKNILGLFSLLLILIGCKSSQYPELGDGLFADIQTNKGNIILKLEHEKFICRINRSNTHLSYVLFYSSNAIILCSRYERRETIKVQ